MSEGKIRIPISEYRELIELKTKVKESEDMGKVVEMLNRLVELGEYKQTPIIESEDSQILTDKEKKIFDYIKTHPNVSKQDIVNKFKTSYSRVTVFKILDKLSNYEMIIVTQDPENRQTHKLVFNQKSLLLSLMRETDQLKNAFIRVLTKLKGIIKQNIGDDLHIQSIVTFLSDMIQLYKDILDQYIMKMVFDWSERTSSKNVLARAYSIAFSSLSSVLAEIASLYQYCSNNATFFATIYADLYEPSPKSYKDREDAIRFGEDFKINQEVNNLIEIARISLSSAAAR